MALVETHFGPVLRLLNEAKVDFIVIGGLAAIAHGAGRATYDVDVVYARDRKNIERLVAALAPIEPYLRGAPPGLPFRFDVQTAVLGLNFTFTTKLGNLDLLGEVTGGGRYEDILPFSCEMTGYGTTFPALDLAKLIEVKRAAGRPKDFEVIAELEAIRQEAAKLRAEGQGELQ